MSSSNNHTKLYAATHRRPFTFVVNPEQRHNLPPQGPYVEQDIEFLLNNPQFLLQVKGCQLEYVISTLGNRGMDYCFQLISHLTNTSRNHISEVYEEHAKIVAEDKILPETKLGRRLKHTPDHLPKVMEFMESHKGEWITLEDIQIFITKEFGTAPDCDTLRKWLQTQKIKAVKAKKIERPRGQVPSSTIREFFNVLMREVDGKPACLVINGDEVGYSGFADAKTDFGSVCESWNTDTVYYPVDRNGHRATGCIAITADGTLLKPFFLVRRATVTEDLYTLGFKEDFDVSNTASSFINERAFEEWIRRTILPYVRKTRSST